MIRIRVHPDRPAPRKLQAAVDAVVRGGVIIYPSDTGYAFGCRLSSSKGVSKLRKLKGLGERDRKPLSMLVQGLGDFGRYGHMTNQAFRLIRRLLPGAYTMVLRATSDVPRGMHNRNHEVGLRIPDHALCAMLVDMLAEPLLIGSVSSADSEPELEQPEFYETQFAKDVDVVVDGGPLWPEPSTVLRFDQDEYEILREGQGPVPEGI